jgi:hypothetical protein
MDRHRRDEPSIVAVLADDRRRGHEQLPHAVDGRRLIEPKEQGFEARELRRGFSRGLAQATDGGGRVQTTQNS